MLFQLHFAWKRTLLSALKGNNSSKTYNFRITVGNVQMIYYIYEITCDSKYVPWRLSNFVLVLVAFPAPHYFFSLPVCYIFVVYTDISCLGGVFAKNTIRETKNFVDIFPTEHVLFVKPVLIGCSYH
jgi:hypothetical protein